jgi:predicted  nucleic acid-binding Zn-ribbon protein
MKASPSDQRQILDIQRHDLVLTTLAHKLATLPEIASLGAATVKSNNTRDLRIGAETELSDVTRELKRAEGDVEQVFIRIQKDEARLNSGTGTPKELESLQHEVVTLNARRAELEEVELEVMLRVDGIKSRIDELKALEATLATEISELTDRKNMASLALESESAQVKNERVSTVASVDKALYDLYEKIRSNGGIGAASLLGGQCLGCNLTINAIDLKRMLDSAEDEVIRCEECRCILVRGV